MGWKDREAKRGGGNGQAELRDYFLKNISVEKIHHYTQKKWEKSFPTQVQLSV